MVLGELANCIAGFPLRVHANEARFHIPVHIRRKFSLHDGDAIGIVIFVAETSECLYTGVEPLRSGGEIYGETIRQSVKPEQAVTVVVYRLPS